MKLGIRLKIILITSFVMVFVISLTTYFGVKSSSEIYQEALHSETFVIARDIKLELERLLASGVSVGELSEFESRLQQIVNSYEEVDYAMVIDSSGLVLYHNEPSKIGESIGDADMLEAVTSQKEVALVSTSEEENLSYIFVPVNDRLGGHIATVSVVASHGEINQELVRLLTSTIAVATVFTLLSIVVLIAFLSLWVTKPMGKLTDIVLTLSKGDFSKRVDLKTGDEIEDLGLAFNKMADELQHWYITLEKKVQVGTQQPQKISEELENRQSAILNVLEDQKDLEENLKEERDRVSLILSSMGEGLLVINRDYSLSVINPAAEKLLGVKKEEVVGTKWYEIVAAYKGNHEVPLEERVSYKVMKTGVMHITQLENDHYYFTKGQKKFPVVSVTTPVLSKEEGVVGVVKVFRDATEDKEMKIIIEQTVKSQRRELKEEQVKSQSILENTGEGIVVTDDMGCVVYVNPAFTKIAGYTNEGLGGKDYAAEIEMYDLKGKLIKPAKRSDAAAVTAENQESKILLKKKDGGSIAVVVNAAPIVVGRTFKGVVRVVHDITEDVKLQQQKDDFFSIASHELRTPLSVISGNLDNVLEGYGESQLSELDKNMLQDTLLATDRLIKMVNDFLNVSRLDQGRVKMEMVKVNACQIIKDIVSELQPLAGEKGLELSGECKSESAFVSADENLFKEILVNLIGNSVKFTEKGFIKVTQEVEGDSVVMRISDSGSGISEDKRDLLFQRFQQAMDRTLAREAGGTGLGLYISREFARLMRGELVLESSEVGKGSVFRLTLPVAGKNPGQPVSKYSKMTK